MKTSVFIGTLASAGLMAGVAAAGTVDDIKAKGFVQCGVSTGVAGFAFTDAAGEWDGFDVTMCRAVAAAVFGDPKAIKFTPTTGKTRFTALASGEVDVLFRNTTWTYSRDADLKFTFVGVNYYDGQGFMVPKALGVSSAKELDGATVCIQTGTTTELNLADYFRANGTQRGDVDVRSSATGGAWVTRQTYFGVDDIGPISFDLTPYAAADLQVAFHFYNAIFDWYWGVDDVVVRGSDSIIFADGFESGTTTAWSATEPP